MKEESLMADMSAGPPSTPPALGANAHIVPNGGKRLIVTGQIGIRPDGTLERGLRAQIERAFSNLLAVCKVAGFHTADLVKISVVVTEPGRVLLYREVRDKALGGHRCPNTYVQVAGLSSPTFGWP